MPGDASGRIGTYEQRHMRTPHFTKLIIMYNVYTWLQSWDSKNLITEKSRKIDMFSKLQGFLGCWHNMKLDDEIWMVLDETVGRY